jgi:uncharacterized protein (TIGR02391 family)
MENICFTDSQVLSIAQALGDTTEGLKGVEIERILGTCRIDDIAPTATKWVRLQNAFANDQNKRKHRRHILEFIRRAMRPELYARESDRFERMRENLNRALAFAGLQVIASGELEKAEPARTLSEAQHRVRQLRGDLTTRGVHPDVLVFCREELLVDNYFHAVLEAMKSVMEKIRTKTGLPDDGNALIDRALAGDSPLLAINALSGENERSEQRGFANLVRGACSMFRNPAAHAPRLHWAMSKEDAEDLLSLASLIHRRLDAARIFSHGDG